MKFQPKHVYIFFDCVECHTTSTLSTKTLLNVVRLTLQNTHSMRESEISFPRIHLELFFSDHSDRGSNFCFVCESCLYLFIDLKNFIIAVIFGLCACLNPTRIKYNNTVFGIVDRYDSYIRPLPFVCSSNSRFI